MTDSFTYTRTSMHIREMPEQLITSLFLRSSYKILYSGMWNMWIFTDGKTAFHRLAHHHCADIITTNLQRCTTVSDSNSL